MCTFCSDLPSNERGNQKSFITLFLKENDVNNEKEAYRFRLLNFRAPEKSDRKYPFISRYVHNHWAVNESGNKVVDETVVCPASSFIDARNDVALGFSDTFKELKLKNEKPTWDLVCPVCRHSAQAWNAYNNSGKTDQLAKQRGSELKRQFQAIIPVFVVNDPINPKNKNRFKCFIINDKKEYETLITLVNSERAKIAAAGNSYNWCNGVNAVDFYVRVGKVPVTYKNGQTGTRRGIVSMMFGRKPYDLVDASGKQLVTKEAINKFEFDEQFYVKNSKMELEAFYDKYYSMVTANVPDEDLDMGAMSAPPAPAAPAKVPVNVAPKKEEPVPQAVVDDLVSDPDDVPFEGMPPKEPAAEPLKAPEQSVEDMLAELDFHD